MDFLFHPWFSIFVPRTKRCKAKVLQEHGPLAPAK
jgi:hypothetical protein